MGNYYGIWFIVSFLTDGFFLYEMFGLGSSGFLFGLVLVLVFVDASPQAKRGVCCSLLSCGSPTRHVIFHPRLLSPRFAPRQVE
jgi:hypothetical protein